MSPFILKFLISAWYVLVEIWRIEQEASRMSRQSAGHHDKAISRAEARRKRIENQKAAKVDALVNLWPDLVDALEDRSNVMLDFRIKIKEGGDYIGILKREQGVDEEVIFSGGEDFVEVMTGLDRGVASEKWKPSVPWKPNQ